MHVNTKKKPSYGSRKANLLDKRMSVFTNTYAGNNKKRVKEINTYNMAANYYFDLNKTFDAMNNSKMAIDSTDSSQNSKFFKSSFTQQLNSKTNPKPYINTLLDKSNIKKENLIKQKPAAPEITRKIPIQIGNMSASMSDSNMTTFINTPSTKGFGRPKSMERIKRKQPMPKKKQVKSKIRAKKSKKKTRNENNLFDASNSLNISHMSSTHMYRRQKLEEDIDKL